MNLGNVTPQINSDFSIEQFDGEVLLFNVLSKKAVYLNETAHLIWQLCSGNRSVEELIELLEDAYPDHKEQVKNDIMEALQHLNDIGAISCSD